MDSEIPFTNLLRCNHRWPFCHALTLTRLTLTILTLTSIIMRSLTILFPVTQTGTVIRGNLGRAMPVLLPVCHRPGTRPATSAP